MEIYNISQKRGESWKGMTINYRISGDNVDLTDAYILMQLKKNHCDTDAVVEFSTTSGSIVIDAPLSGTFSIEPYVFDITPKEYVYDLMVELPSQDRIDYLIGGTFEITSNVSRK